MASDEDETRNATARGGPINVGGELALVDMPPDVLAAIFGGTERVTRNPDGSYTHTYTPPEWPKPRRYTTIERVEDSDKES